jgi:tetratricopeptide (TPR) repeat protein
VPKQAGRHVDSPAAAGRRIRAARLRAGLSQRDLAFEGCTYAYISRLESGQRTPSMQLLQEFGKRLGVSATYLARGTDAPDTVDPLDDADLAARLGDLDAADAAYEEIAADATAAAVRRARALAGLGESAFRRGDHARAETFFEQARALEALAPTDDALIGDRLGRIYSLRGESERAIAGYEDELRRARDREDAAATLRFSTLLANAVLDAGNAGRAEELLAQALGAADSSADPLDRARLWWSQSRLHDSRSRPELAAKYARMAAALLEEIDHAEFAAVAYQLLAYVENERGNGREALDLLERAEPVIAAGGNAFHRSTCLLERARALLNLGEHEEAASLAMASLPGIVGTGAIESGRAQVLLGDVFRELGDDARATELYELALETLPSFDRHRMNAVSGLAEVLERQGRRDEAFALLKSAMAARQPSPAP